jgi:importin subunit beta-1
MFDYVVSLREGIMDAWGGIIGAMKAGEKSMFLSFLVKVHLLTC